MKRLIILVSVAPILLCSCRIDDAGFFLDDALKQASSYEFGQDREPLTVVQDLVRESLVTQKDRRRAATKLAQYLQTNASTDSRDFVCRQLALVGTKHEVPVLAEILRQGEQASIAMYALERIPGAVADKALLDALSATDGKTKIGVINALGKRRYQKAVGELGLLLEDEDDAVAQASARALGKIGNKSAAGHLTKALQQDRLAPRQQLESACLLCADALMKSGHEDAALDLYETLRSEANSESVRIASMLGLVRAKDDSSAALLTQLLNGVQTEFNAALLAIREIPGRKITETTVSMLPELETGKRALCLLALGDRGDQAAAGAVFKCAHEENPDVRIAAFRALGFLGDASHVPFLAEVAASASEAEEKATRDSLGRIRGPRVNSKIVSELQHEGVEEVRIELISALGRRNAFAEIDTLFETAKDSSEEVRIASRQVSTHGVRWRVEPDNVVSRSKGARSEQEPTRAKDAQLAKALELLRAELARANAS